MAATATSCHVIEHDYDGDRQLTPGTELLRESRRIGEIHGKKRALYTLFGFVSLNRPSGAELAEDLAEEAYGQDFDGITRIEIEEYYDALDVITSTLFSLLVSTRTVEVRGAVNVFEARAPR